MSVLAFYELAWLSPTWLLVCGPVCNSLAVGWCLSIWAIPWFKLLFLTAPYSSVLNRGSEGWVCWEEWGVCLGRESIMQRNYCAGFSEIMWLSTDTDTENKKLHTEFCLCACPCLVWVLDELWALGFQCLGLYMSNYRFELRDVLNTVISIWNIFILIFLLWIWECQANGVGVSCLCT